MFYYATEIHSYVFDNENKSLYEMPQKCAMSYIWFGLNSTLKFCKILRKGKQKTE